MSADRPQTSLPLPAAPADFSPPPVFATADDLGRLRELARWGAGETWGASLLLREIERIHEGVAPAGAPFARLGSEVTYKDLGTKRIHRVRLTGSRAGKSHTGAVSVLSVLGAALIGLCEGAIFRWMEPDGRFRAVKVLAVEPWPGDA